MSIPETILQQLGGQRFVIMTGAFGFVAKENVLAFCLPACLPTNGVRYVRITLDPSDTYTMRFWRLESTPDGPKDIVIAEHDDVYCDMLEDIFTEVTGIYTRLQ